MLVELTAGGGEEEKQELQQEPEQQKDVPSCPHVEEGLERRMYSNVLRCRPCIEAAFRSSHPEATQEQLNTAWKNASDANRESRKNYKRKLCKRRTEKTNELEGRITDLEKKLRRAAAAGGEDAHLAAELEVAVERADKAETALREEREATKKLREKFDAEKLGLRQQVTKVEAEKVSLRQQAWRLEAEKAAVIKTLAVAELRAAAANAASGAVQADLRSATRPHALGHKLAEDDIFADVSLACDGDVKIRAHRAVLAANSDYFKALFLTPWRTASTEETAVFHTGYSADLIRPVVGFVYTGEIPDDFVESRARDLFDAASEYQLIRLRDRCERLCVKKLSLDTFKHTTLLAHVHRSSTLLEPCFAFAKQHAPQLLVRPEVMGLAGDHPDLWKELAGYVSGEFPDFRHPPSWNDGKSRVDNDLLARAKKKPVVKRKSIFDEDNLKKKPPQKPRRASSPATSEPPSLVAGPAALLEPEQPDADEPASPGTKSL
ncbi:hypothetical protein CTAYLR_008311 [Chrysophaeum taylorii]|uniref:BTB domain-containing protein n=1 Tax=Chrysophaeum taylorii TaxID=2483200 RepID=A0AAD7XJJ2_9STRA|nr:hypothetical protein CTAYLR_008311 [Chrysophaeum taylorii]